MKKTVYLSYDLGFDGDYEGLYRFLDQHQATECGSSLARFTYNYITDLKAELTKELETHISVTPKVRIYIIFKNGDDIMKGIWLYGNRKNPPWAGYHIAAKDLEEDSE